MNLIAAVDNHWAIGCHNDLLVHIPADQKFFRTETMGKVVIMGRKTWESLPNKQPLQERTNIVITRKKEYHAKGATVVHSIEEALETVKDIPSKDIYVIGGGEIYAQLLPYCDLAQITKIDYTYQADTYFPNLDKNSEWKLTGISEEQTYYDLVYEFCRYERVANKIG